MKRLVLVFIAASFVLAMCGASFAHLPPDVTFYCFQFPDAYVPVMDGDVSDWDMVPDQYWVTQDQLTETVIGVGSEWDASNLAVRLIAAWNKTSNLLYFMEDRYDDHFYPINQVGNPDTWEIVIDADHSGGQFQVFRDVDQETAERLGSAQAQNWQYRLMDPNVPENWFWGKSMWQIVPPYSDIGWSFDGPSVGEAGKLYTERYMTAFDDLDWHGPETSKLHILEEGAIIGIGYSVIDEDDPETGGYNGYWNLGGDTSMYYMAEALSDFLLVPIDPSVEWPGTTSVEAASWGRIKSSFVK